MLNFDNVNNWLIARNLSNKITTKSFVDFLLQNKFKLVSEVEHSTKYFLINISLKRFFITSNDTFPNLNYISSSVFDFFTIYLFLKDDFSNNFEINLGNNKRIIDLYLISQSKILSKNHLKIDSDLLRDSSIFGEETVIPVERGTFNYYGIKKYFPINKVTFKYFSTLFKDNKIPSYDARIDLPLPYINCLFYEKDDSILPLILNLNKETITDIIYKRAYLCVKKGFFSKIQIGQILNFTNRFDLSMILRELKETNSLTDSYTLEKIKKKFPDYYDINFLVAKLKEKFKIDFITGSLAIEFLINKININRLFYSLDKNDDKYRQKFEIYNYIIENKLNISDCVINYLPIISLKKRPVFKDFNNDMFYTSIDEIYKRVFNSTLICRKYLIDPLYSGSFQYQHYIGYLEKLDKLMRKTLEMSDILYYNYDSNINFYSD